MLFCLETFPAPWPCFVAKTLFLKRMLQCPLLRYQVSEVKTLEATSPADDHGRDDMCHMLLALQHVDLHLTSSPCRQQDRVIIFSVLLVFLQHT